MFSWSVQAQNPYAWHWGPEDGLPSSEAYEIFEDSKGYIWIGTDKGVCKYNGEKFAYYHNKVEKGEAISHFQEDSNGRIWMRNFKNQIFYVENDSLHYFEALDKLPSFEFSEFIIDSKDCLWMVSKFESVVFRFQPKVQKWKKWELPSETRMGIYGILEIENYNFYVSSNRGIYQIDREDKLHLVVDIFSDTILSLTPSFLYKDQSNNVLIYQHLKDVDKLKMLVNNKVKPIPNYKNRAASATRADLDLIIDKYNTVWEMTSEGTSVVLNPDSSRGIEKDLLLYPDEGIGYLTIDREDNYWVSSLTNGVRMIPNLFIQLHYQSNSVLGDILVESIEEIDEKRLAIGTSEKELWIYNTQSKKIEWKKKLPNNAKYLRKTTDKLLVGLEHFHMIFNLKDSIHEISRTDYLSICSKNNTIYKDTNLIVSAAEGFGVFNIKDANWGYKDSLNPLCSKDVKFVRHKDNSFQGWFLSNRCNWVIEGSQNNYFLAALADKLMCYRDWEEPYEVLDEDGQSIQANYLEKAANGIIWVCSANKGIYGLDDNLNIKYHFTLKNGLIHNTIDKIKIDQNNIWLVSSKGVQAFNLETEESHIYTIHDGLPTYDIKDIAILDGRIWLATAKGLVTFNKNMQSKNETPPLIYIKNVEIHDKPVALKDQYELDYTQDNIVVYVEGIAYRSQGAFQYKHRMIGIDSIWRYQPSQTNFIRFPQLEPGKYRFEVLAVNEDGVESETVAVILFFIAAPYWQRWWFILLVAMVVIGIVASIVWGQMQQLRLKNQNSNLRMEALQSQMNPHFIFNVLTAVQNLWLQHKNEAAMNLQSNFAKLLRKIFQYSSKRAIRIEQVEEFINNYLRLEQIRFEDQVAINFDIEDELLDEDYMIPPLLIQPIIENSFKHGLFHKDSDRQLFIEFKKEGAYLYVCVEDNGVGRKPKPKNSPKRSSGLSTTKERLAILQDTIIGTSHPHNNFKITDLKTATGEAKGTKVELWIPFVNNY